MLARIAAAAVHLAALALGLNALDGQRAKTERVAKAGGEFFKLHHAPRLGLLMNAVDRRHAEIFEPCCDALIGGEHEFLNEAVGPGALGLGNAAHLSLLVELDHRLGQVEIN